MRNITTILLFFLFIAQSVCSQSFQATDSTQISLLTSSPGKEVYAKFGHTSLRVSDKSQNFDVAFNYGLFSFNTSNFYYKFIKGETYYTLGAVEMRYFLPEYIENNQSVTEQVINLTLPEKQKLVSLLMENYKPENREYLYNFVYDNCATRPREIIENSVNGHIEYNNRSFTGTSFRELVSEYVGKNTWLMFGIDLIFGSESDKSASRLNTMFLPEKMLTEFKTAQITNVDQPTRELVSSEKILVEKQPEACNESNLNVPFIVMTILLLIGACFFYFERKHKHTKFRSFDSPLFILSGLVGIIAFYLTFISIHPMVGANYNLLWLCPLNIIVGILIWFRPMRKILFFYFFIYTALTFLSFILYVLNVQSLNIAFIPLILLLQLRSISWILRCRKNVFHKKHKSSSHI